MIISNSQTKPYFNPNKQRGFSSKVIKAVHSKRVINTKTWQKSLINYALNSNFLIFPFVISTIGDFISLFFNAKANLKNNEAQAFPLFCQELSNKICNLFLYWSVLFGVQKVVSSSSEGFMQKHGSHLPENTRKLALLRLSEIACLPFGLIINDLLKPWISSLLTKFFLTLGSEKFSFLGFNPKLESESKVKDN